MDRVVAMFQIVLIVVVVLIFYLYLRSRGGMRIKKPKDELKFRCDFYYEQVMNFLQKLKRSRSETRVKRLESEIERFQKAMDLDDLLEKAEKETSSRRAIDYYLEALSFVMKNNFEEERKAEIEEKIKNTQQRKRSSTIGKTHPL